MPKKRKRASANNVSSKKKSRNLSPSTWPYPMTGNLLRWASQRCDFDSNVVEVQLNGKKKYGSINIKRLIPQSGLISVTFADANTYVMIQGHPLFKVDRYDIPHASVRATRLVNHLSNLVYPSVLEFTQVVREHSISSGTTSTTDSDVERTDDEEYIDPELPRAFSDGELMFINHYFKRLWTSFRIAQTKSFQNHAGKRFFGALGDYLRLVFPPDQQDRLLSDYSTNPNGLAQPGNCKLDIASLKPQTRKSDAPSYVVSKKTMVADYVLFDANKDEYCVVGEIKSDDEDAETQNLYQMIACFRENQKVMLGFTVNDCKVIPRILCIPETVAGATTEDLPLAEATRNSQPAEDLPLAEATRNSQPAGASREATQGDSQPAEATGKATGDSQPAEATGEASGASGDSIPIEDTQLHLVIFQPLPMNSAGILFLAKLMMVVATSDMVYPVLNLQ